ncbi:hypothetical protein TNCV_1877351 [Trichonephila clavipes]|nr:hypothetical protein TNCV_1877351 [Trichonephila clavipes]
MNDLSSFKKYKCLTISEKKKVIESVEEGERKVDIAKVFEIPLNSLSTILKNKEKIFSASSSRVRKRVSKVVKSVLDNLENQQHVTTTSILTALIMIDKAWRAVTPLTIHSCFKNSSRTRFDDYVLVDTDIAVWGAVSDAKIVALDHNNTESDEDESEELTPVTLSIA